MRSKSLGLSTILAASACAVSGCDKIPGTDAYKIKIAQEVAARDLIDPSSAQFRDLKVRKDIVCGEINAKNRMGAYVGFKRFFADSKAKTASIDPGFDFNDLLSAQDLCRSARSNSYSSYSLIKSACDREMEQTLTQVLQNAFDSGWTLHCEGKSSSEKAPVSAGDVLSNDVDALEEDATANVEDDAFRISNGELDAEGSDVGLVDEDGEPIPDDDRKPSGAPDQSELDRIFRSPLPKRESRPATTQPDSNSLADPLQPPPDE